MNESQFISLISILIGFLPFVAFCTARTIRNENYVGAILSCGFLVFMLSIMMVGCEQLLKYYCGWML